MKRAAGTTRRTQAERRAQTRSALLEAAARGLSTYGYANLRLERVASEAGYTRGALYHLFENKEDLALAVVGWVDETWTAEVGHLAADETDAVAALIAMARAHAVYCRRDVARVMLALRVEFTRQDHPVGRAITEILDPLEATCARLVDAGRRSGAIPSGPPANDIANAYLSTLEAVGIALAGREPYDVQLAERAVRGLLGLRPAADPPAASRAEASTTSTGEGTDQ
jgi:AcrR family transcriptional regulator